MWPISTANKMRSYLKSPQLQEKNVTDPIPNASTIFQSQQQLPRVSTLRHAFAFTSSYLKQRSRPTCTEEPLTSARALDLPRLPNLPLTWPATEQTVGFVLKGVGLPALIRRTRLLSEFQLSWQGLCGPTPQHLSSNRVLPILNLTPLITVVT